MNTEMTNEYADNSYMWEDEMEVVVTHQDENYDDDDEIGSDFLGMAVLRGVPFNAALLKLLGVWSVSTVVTSSRISFNSETDDHRPMSAILTLLENVKNPHNQQRVFTEEIFYIALCFVNKLHAKTGIAINRFNYKAIFITALCLANKTQFDRCYGVGGFDALAGFPSGTVLRFESLFLNAIDWESEIHRRELKDVISSLDRIHLSLLG